MENVMFNAKDSLIEGVNLISDAVMSTFGPHGQNVLIKSPSGLHITKDGATVAKFIQSEDPFKNLGVDIIREIAMKTAKDVGDGTTSATVLAKSIVNGLKNNPDHSITINRILQEDIKKVLDLLEKQKINIESKEDLIKVATMSVNGDTELGELIGATYHTVGKDGVVLVEESSETDTSVDITNGVKFEGGYHSPYFINNLKNECVLENVSVVCYEKKITTMKDIEKDCIEAINNNKALLIIAPHVESSVMMTLLRNRDAGKLQSCCVKTPGQGIFRTMLLEDIKAIKNVSKIIAGREEVVIIGEIEEKVKEIEIEKD